jgi:hypothetical protein
MGDGVGGGEVLTATPHINLHPTQELRNSIFTDGFSKRRTQDSHQHGAMLGTPLNQEEWLSPTSYDIFSHRSCLTRSPVSLSGCLLSCVPTVSHNWIFLRLVKIQKPSQHTQVRGSPTGH